MYLGEMEGCSIQAQGYRGGGNIQGEETGEGKLNIIWGDSGIFILEKQHGEASQKKHTADNGGRDRGGGGGTSYLCGFLPLVAKDGEMEGGRLSGSSA